MEEKETCRDRVYKFLKETGMSARAFQNKIGVSVSYVHNMGEGMNQMVVERVKRAFPELNTNWLLTGNGNMMKSRKEMIVEQKVTDMAATEEGANASSQSNSILSGCYIPLLPVSAQAGTLREFSECVSGYDCEIVVSPVKDAELAITVTGDSMCPEFTNGSKVLIKKINQKAFIDWGKAYVLDTCNGVILKRVFPSERDGYVRCVSINPEFPPFEVSESDIFGMYVVLMCLSLK